MPDYRIDAGDLDTRVTLLSPVYNEFEDEIVDWTPVTEVWAAINPSYGQEMTGSDRTVSVLQVPIVIRFRTDIDSRWRVRDRNHEYEIKAIVDVARMGVQLQLICDEVL